MTGEEGVATRDLEAGDRHTASGRTASSSRPRGPLRLSSSGLVGLQDKRAIR
jgi:hypothetical protein